MRRMTKTSVSKKTEPSAVNKYGITNLHVRLFQVSPKGSMQDGVHAPEARSSEDRVCVHRHIGAYTSDIHKDSQRVGPCAQTQQAGQNCAQAQPVGITHRRISAILDTTGGVSRTSFSYQSESGPRSFSPLCTGAKESVGARAVRGSSLRGRVIVAF
jgi:hypothetical protein